MAITSPQPDLQQAVLSKLDRALDLVLKTAEAASAENNHKVVIQAVREVTRIATLITKITNPKNRSGHQVRESDASAALKKNKSAPRPQPVGGSFPGAKKPGEADIRPEDLLLPDLATFFPPHQVDSLDDVSRELFDNISRGYSEMQAIGAEMADSLKKKAQGNGKGV
jgi:hypothetical protein